MSTPLALPTQHPEASYDGKLLSLQWIGEVGVNYVVEVKCPNWGSTYCTDVDQPRVKIGVTGSKVEYRVGLKNHVLPDFLSIDAPTETPAEPELLLEDSKASAAAVLLTSEASTAAVPPTSDAAWLQSLDLSSLLAEALKPLGAGHASLASAMGALDEAAVVARLREVDIAAGLARVLANGGKALLPTTATAQNEVTMPVEAAATVAAPAADKSSPPVVAAAAPAEGVAAEGMAAEGVAAGGAPEALEAPPPTSDEPSAGA